jgi:hypothetical protein
MRDVDPGDEYQIKIKELLGYKDYATYQAYKERSSEAYRLKADLSAGRQFPF